MKTLDNVNFFIFQAFFVKIVTHTLKNNTKNKKLAKPLKIKFFPYFFKLG